MSHNYSYGASYEYPGPPRKDPEPLKGDSSVPLKGCGVDTRQVYRVDMISSIKGV